jgi:molybdate transport system ATP-binding protein
MTTATADILRVDIRVEREAMPVCAAFEIPAHSTLALIGPNGSGKSTIAHAIAGLIPGVIGTITLGDQAFDSDADRLAIRDRRIGCVFQSPMLFGHMRVIDNVAYGIRAAGVSKRESRNRAAPFLERFGIADLAMQRADRLSGGQAQRVAIARAVAMEPRVLILDEPFAAIDAKAKIELRQLVRDILVSFPGPCLYITHDPIDALTLGDKIAVIEAGRITQVGTPDQLQREPRSAYAASFLGINLIEGTLRDTPDGWCVEVEGDKRIWITDPDLATGTPVCLVIAPEAITLSAHAPEGSARNVFEACVEAVHVQHDRVRVRFDAPAVGAEITVGSMNRLGIDAGVRVWISFKATDVRVYPRRTGQAESGASND